MCVSSLYITAKHTISETNFPAKALLYTPSHSTILDTAPVASGHLRLVDVPAVEEHGVDLVLQIGCWEC